MYLHCEVFIVIVNVLVFFLQGGHCKTRDILKASVQLIEKESKKLDTSSCKSTTETNVVKLRLADKNDEAVICLIKLLSENPEKGWAWSELGHQYNLAKKKSKATTCFKQAAKLTGKLSKFIDEWHFIGPFGIGKAELDGDPMQWYGGIANASKERYKKKATYYSELVNGGEIHWRLIHQKAARDPLEIALHDVPWQDLMSQLGSFAILEWQGWLVGEFAVNGKDEDVLIRCLGVHTVFIDGQILAADVYRRSQYWYSVSLSQGIHTVYIRLRSKQSQVIHFDLKLAGSSTFNVISPSMIPDLVDGHLVGNVIALPITNLQSDKWIKNVRVQLLSQQGGPTNLEVTQLKDRGSVQIAPGQTMLVVVSLKEVEPNEGDLACTDTLMTLKISASDGTSQELNIKLRCRKRRESFLITFLDHDGSVQSAAAIEPLEDCPGGSCPVLLSLHGTGVEAQSQADSYKRMEDGQWIFGLEKAWVLTPTRHGAHNWEGPGALTSMTALETLQQLTHNLVWMTNKADASRVIFAGHSMGGHGAWHLATHYPDRALAVISLAGWIKKEEYGDSNVFFRHDISTSHTDPVVKAIMEACIAENDADRHVSNLKGIPVLARIGARDVTVHPYFVRRMNRLLREIGVNVTYAELPDKPHWWWDTWTTNDGGAVNDPQLRNFANEVATTEKRSLDTQSCDAEGLDCTKSNYPLRYSGIENMEHSGKWTLTVMNPALGEGMLGVRILQQTVPFRTSKVEIEFTENAETKLKTVNVDKFSLGPSQRVMPSWSQRKLEIDGIILDLSTVDSSKSAGTIPLCRDNGTKWQVCESEERLGGSEEVRGPINLGPARRIAERRFIIVIGTQDKSQSQSQLNMAVYLANLFYLTSDTIAPILEDESLTDDVANTHNLIIIGGPDQNQWTHRFLEKVPLSLHQTGLSLGSCTFEDTDLGALFLAPHQGDGLALVLLGTSTKGLNDVIRLASPTIPPMTRSPFSNMVPDYVVTGPEFRAKGPGGYLCTGFWGNRWEYRRELSSCVC